MPAPLDVARHLARHDCRIRERISSSDLPAASLPTANDAVEDMIPGDSDRDGH
jgi:hypothetical protein